MMEVRIKIDAVDYAAAVDALMPLLLDKVSSGTNPLRFLGRIKGLSATAAKAALDVLPQGTKDELAAACLNRYSEEISQAATNLAKQKNLNVNVQSVEVLLDN